jgi:tRNA A-37 threonylcarbamoyl transferase component Bud32
MIESIGSYRILEKIGEGGMGEVFRATDTILKRHVALKVLRSEVANTSERIARFQREAEVLASLNHPNIAHLYGIEKSNGILALVMELVEGETLADRIAEGNISLDEALPIAKQIAEALEAAHEQGIIHRDLKPGNIKLRDDGTVKVLDFGLAKALEPTVASGSAAALANSPTITSPALETGVGVLLGTAAYMSPEQAKGRPADKRSDIWAFGCVLFEMLTGTRPFGGKDVAETMAAVIRAEPSWASLPARTPAAITRLLKRCLHKDPRQRLQHAGDARLELTETEWAATSDSAPHQATSARWWMLATAVAVVAAAIAVLALRMRNPEPVGAPVSRFAIRIPDAATISTTSSGYDVALSPDGRTLLFSGPGSGVYKRRLDATAFEPLRGAEIGLGPFFSPDGAWVGFLSEGKLKKVPIEGGLPITICDTPFAGARGTWGEDGTIVFTAGGDLYQVSENGGAIQPILKAGGDDGAVYSQPRFVPGSKTVLVRNGGPTGASSGRIEAIELSTLKRHPLVEGTAPQLSATGDLLFQQQGALWAVRFNPGRLAIEGAPVRMIESVWTLVANAAFSAARGGTLAYVAGSASSDRSIVWIDHGGKVTPAADTRGQLQSPRLSPNGKLAVVSATDGGSLGLWLYDLDRGTRQRLTTDANSRRTAWSPDATQFAFYSVTTPGVRQTASDQDLYVMPSTGGEPKLLLKRPGLQYPDSWSPDGRFLIFEDGEGPEASIGARRDLWLLPLRKTPLGIEAEAPQRLLVTRFNERGAVFAPDGRHIAFVSDESGRPEIYVQPFPGQAPKIPISTNGGLQPVWSRHGDELFYREGNWLMSVALQREPFRAGSPRRLFEFPGVTYNLDQNFADYDVAPDGRFLAIRSDVGARGQDIQLVLNWTEDLRRALGR